MHYHFAKDRPNYARLASGHVFYSRPGFTAFPIRLASELFQQCQAVLVANQGSMPCVLYDPCCGAAYHLSVLSYLHRPSVRMVIGSDINQEATQLAERNLGLLTIAGLDRRIQELNELITEFGKSSHRDAIQSGLALRKNVAEWARSNPLRQMLFQADATDGAALKSSLESVKVDMVLTDVPYGHHSQWTTSHPITQPTDYLDSLLDALLEVLAPISVVAICSDKRQKIRNTNYQRIKQFLVGKRRVTILRPTHWPPHM
ncbi:MAG: rRNA methyltransferase [Terriglobia bacterium]